MKILIVRHAESANNVLSMVSYDLYIQNRSPDPNLTETGIMQAEKVGKFLKENNFKIDKIYSSASDRALATCAIILKVYGQVSSECWVDIHEFGGCYFGDTGYPGQTDIQIKEKYPSIEIPSDVDLSKGWWKSENKETEDELKERIKRIMDRLKEMAMKVDENHTILLISHGAFLNYFFSTLTQSECFLDSKYWLNSDFSFGFKNTSISSIEINKKKEVSIDFINMIF